ncbi:MAG: carbohydrate-binding family 9-like protein [Bacteroidales bacterium]|nr:carbohydrate-binding family 9-like protein [Bacteroidales bacterium]
MKKQTALPLIQALDLLRLESDSDNISELICRQGSGLSLDCLNWPGEFPYAPETRLSLGRSSSGIYLHYVVEEKEKRTSHHSDNAPVWQDSCVEFFVALPSEEEYFNFEFNSLGYCLAARRKSREEYVLFSPEQLALIERIPGSASICPEVAGKSAQSWSLIVYIPFILLGLDCKRLPSVLKANFYKCCSACTEKHYLSWSPVHSEKPDFHRPQDFGLLLVQN